MSAAIRKTVNWLSIACLATLTMACAGTPRPSSSAMTTASRAEPDPVATSPAHNPGLAALDVAREMLGVSYRYGGTDPRGFDCSGLVRYAYSHAGIELPRTAQEIFRRSQLVSPGDVQPGDLLFFTISAAKVSHVGIYDDHQRFIHAPSSGKGVSYASLEEAYWSKRLVAVGRVRPSAPPDESAASCR